MKPITGPCYNTLCCVRLFSVCYILVLLCRLFCCCLTNVLRSRLLSNELWSIHYLYSGSRFPERICLSCPNNISNQLNTIQLKLTVYITTARYGWSHWSFVVYIFIFGYDLLRASDHFSGPCSKQYNGSLLCCIDCCLLPEQSHRSGGLQFVWMLES